jgi:putative DNA primase/helicase
MVATAVSPNVAAFLAALGPKNYRREGPGWTALCPAHDDKRASLSVTEGKDGKLLLHCHAGCKFEDVIRAAGVERQRGNGNGRHDAVRIERGRPGIVAEYDYTDENGVLLFQVVRYEPKDFKQRHPDGKGGWVWNVQAVRLVPYRLPEVIEAAALERRVYVVEGEKDADNLAAVGLVATCNPMGVGKWRPEFADSLRGASAVVLPDNDEPGERHAASVAESLHTAGVPVRICRLPNLPPKGDVSDWLDAGGAGEEFQRLADAAPWWQPGTPIESTADSEPSRPRYFSLRDGLASPTLTAPPTPLAAPLVYSARSTLLVAREKVGKSTIAGQLVAALTSGVPFLDLQDGTPTPPPLRVLWYGIDEDINDAMRRLAGYGANLDRAIMCQERDSATEMAGALAEWQPALVVIDTLAELSADHLDNDNDAHAMTRFLRPYTRAARDAGVALLIIHHTKKSGREYRGTGALGASVDAIATLYEPGVGFSQGGGSGSPPPTAEEDEAALCDPRRILEIRARWGRRAYKLTFDGARYCLGEKQPPVPTRALWAFRDGYADSGSTLADALGIKKETAIHVVRQLRESNLLRPVEGNKKKLELTGLGEQAARPVPGTGSRASENGEPGTGASEGSETPEPVGNRGGTGWEPVPEPVEGGNAAIGSHSVSLGRENGNRSRYLCAGGCGKSLIGASAAVVCYECRTKQGAA